MSCNVFITKKQFLIPRSRLDSRDLEIMNFRIRDLKITNFIGRNFEIANFVSHDFAIINFVSHDFEITNHKKIFWKTKGTRLP